jgi:hypothetical protein
LNGDSPLAMNEIHARIIGFSDNDDFTRASAAGFHDTRDQSSLLKPTL